MFSEVVFGTPTDSLESQKDHPMMSALDQASKCTASRFSQPDWLWKLLRFLNLGSERKLKQSIAILDREGDRITWEAIQNAQKELMIH